MSKQEQDNYKVAGILKKKFQVRSYSKSTCRIVGAFLSGFLIPITFHTLQKSHFIDSIELRWKGENVFLSHSKYKLVLITSL